jgi:hypothetical protein
MSRNDQSKRAVFDRKMLPPLFPTHCMTAEFWEMLGRAVVTFGFLEEILGRAIFALTATRPYSESEVEKAYDEWRPRLEHALTGSLSSVADSFGKAVREHPDANVVSIGTLVEDIKHAAEIRNVLCHGSWSKPSPAGASIPRYLDKKMRQFDTAIDIAFLEKHQGWASQLACNVMDTITLMGIRFPGGSGPGKPIF